MSESSPISPLTPDADPLAEPDFIEPEHDSEGETVSFTVEPREVLARIIRSELERGGMSRTERRAGKRDLHELVVADNVDAYVKAPASTGNVRYVHDKAVGWNTVPVRALPKRRSPEPDMLPSTRGERSATGRAADKIRKEATLRTGELLSLRTIWGNNIGTDSYKPKGLKERKAHRRAKAIRQYSDKIATRYGLETADEGRMSVEEALQYARIDTTFKGLADRAREVERAGGVHIPTLPRAVKLPPISSSLFGREREVEEEVRRLELISKRNKQFMERKAAVDRLRGPLDERQLRALETLEEHYDPLSIVMLEEPQDMSTLTEGERAAVIDREEAAAKRKLMFTDISNQIGVLHRKQWKEQEANFDPKKKSKKRTHNRDDGDESLSGREPRPRSVEIPDWIIKALDEALKMGVIADDGAPMLVGALKSNDKRETAKRLAELGMDEDDDLPEEERKKTLYRSRIAVARRHLEDTSGEKLDDEDPQVKALAQALVAARTLNSMHVDISDISKIK